MNLTYKVTAQTSMTSPQSPPNQNRADLKILAAPKPKAAGGAPAAGRLVIGEFGSEPLGVIPSPNMKKHEKQS